MRIFRWHKQVAEPLQETVEGAETENFMVVARAKDVHSGHIREVTVGNYKICLTRVGENFYAFDAFCPHQGWMLWAGEMQGETLRCDKHRWLFNVRTGETLAPSDLPVCLPTFPLRLENQQLLVDIRAVRAVNLARANLHKK